MDLQDFEGQQLYFDEAMPQDVEQLIQAASEQYSQGGAEACLRKAYQIAPTHLSVLVALYRFYYYQHRYQDALDIAFEAMAVAALRIGFPAHWEQLQFADLANGVLHSFTSVRFYLLALKGAGYLNLRMGRIEQGVAMLNKVIELDSSDRLGARVLLQAMGPAVVSQQAVQP
ncbi:MAG: hypothetical protein SV765_13820 [Pseudomonadota bacterium]|nr:hypothetical protein [Pseudomonadales bacterium]MDY6921277.1 hypothetical protein [Pseudomonadota bacterium]|tara:strand:+ start:234 stop:749 length:516 start_codon:yes stop_codon:yes gene_type:complete